MLTDGRPAFVVTKASKSDLFSAQRLAAVRMLLRSTAAEPHASLGSLLTKVNRSLRAGWIEGLSGPGMVGLVALADGAAEWIEAGPVTGVVVRGRGSAEDLRANAPALGEDGDWTYESTLIVLGQEDRIVAITDTHTDSVSTVASVLVDGYVSNSRDALSNVLGQLEPTSAAGADPSDVSATVITRVADPRM